MAVRLCLHGIYFLTLLELLTATKHDIRVDPQSGNFVDREGRTHIFHGVNAVFKKHPWHPSLGSFDARSSLNAEDMANLKLWGFNAIRLGVMWPGVEPTEGKYNTTYLKVMRKLVDDLHSNGIYTIVDFHQDSFSEAWCGEGVPKWLLGLLGPLRQSCNNIVAKIGKLIGQCKSFDDFHIPIDNQTGFPREAECLHHTFDVYSRTPQLVSAWGSFYGNNTIQKKFQDYWHRVAAEFAGAPGVIGYDLINEPLNGDYYADAKNLKPGYLDRHVLQPIYQSLHKAIRSADPEAIVMYEPPPFPDAYPYNIPLMKGYHHLGFTEGPAGKDVTHQALSYHVYSCGFASNSCNRQGDLPSESCPTCDKFAGQAVEVRDADRKRLGGAAFLTEFGACSGSEACLGEIDRVADHADKALHSWAYWQFKYYHDITTVSGPIEGFYHEDDSLQTEKVAALSRTYAPVVAGLPRQMTYNRKTGEFHLKYDIERASANLPTEVYLNKEMNYKNGYNINVVNATVKETSTNRLTVFAKPGSNSVEVSILRKGSGVEPPATLPNQIIV